MYAGKIRGIKNSAATNTMGAAHSMGIEVVFVMWFKHHAHTAQMAPILAL